MSIIIIIAMFVILALVCYQLKAAKPATKEVEYFYFVTNGEFNKERIMASAHEYMRGTDGCDMATALRKTWASAQVEMARYNRK